MSSANDRVPIGPIGDVSCATVLWRNRGQLFLTAVVKATFELVNDAPMRRAPAIEIHPKEVHFRDNPTRSIVATSDLAPHLARADVVLTGHACSPRGGPAQLVVVKLEIARERTLLAKTVHAVGARTPEGIMPFRRIPLVYENAYGGIGNRENPLGKGAGSDRGQPTLIDPIDLKRPAGFAPVSRGWPARKSLITTAQRKAIDLPIMEIPEGFDWAYFQSAPLDQRLDTLRGDEWIVLEGMHAAMPRLRSRLPDAHAICRVYGLTGRRHDAGHLLELQADTLRIDADLLRCSVTWRGSLPMPDEAALAPLRIRAGVAAHGEPIVWPEQLAAGEISSLGGRVSEALLAGAPVTITVDDDDVEIVGEAIEADASLQDEETVSLQDAPPARSALAELTSTIVMPGGRAKSPPPAAKAGRGARALANVPVCIDEESTLGGEEDAITLRRAAPGLAELREALGKPAPTKR